MSNSYLALLTPEQSDEAFPPAELAWDEPNGLLAIGGDLSLDRLNKAYDQGIFPWFNPEEPIYWWTPDPRAVLFPRKVRVTRSLRKSMRNKGYSITIDQAFPDVIKACAAPRNYTDDTWITEEMQQAYIAFHQAGRAHSFEVWSADGDLVGGLYGVDSGNVFSGESMFSLEPDTSKIAFVALASFAQLNNIELIDCQIENPHLMSLGAENISRSEFLHYLNKNKATSSKTMWQFSTSASDLSHWQPMI